MFTLVTKQRCIAAFAAMASAAAAIHCSSGREEFDPTKDASPPVVSAFTEASTPEGAVPEPDLDCSDENKQVYVLTGNDKALYRFNPASLTFARIGKVSCPSSSNTFSMAVDRRGTAWVEYGDGRIFKVSTVDATCTDSGFRPNQLGFTTFGMGFAKNDGDAGGVSAGETLYVANPALGRIDTNTLELSLVGSSSIGRAELTGTGAGTLYAFIENGGRIAHLNKTTAAIEKTYRPAVEVGIAWAFAQWGGDFWLFTAGPSSRSSVTRYSPVTDTTTVVVEDTGILIVGAGVSTCAPSEPPH